MEWHEQALAPYPHLTQLVQEGATGAMNVRTPVRGVEDVYASIGLGAPMQADSNLQAYNVQERILAGREQGLAGEMFTRRTGQAVAAQQVVVPDIANWSSMQQGPALRLGDMLRQAGIPVFAFGNRDRGWADSTATDAGRLGRHVPFLVMDGAGTAYGDVSVRMNMADPGRPYGLRTNYDELFNLLGELPDPAVAVVELGDLDRLYDARTYYHTEQFESLKHIVLSEIDAFAGQLLNGHAAEFQPRLLVLYSPYVHMEAYRTYLRMAPITLWGQEVSTSVLTSPTTRRPGVVSLYDLAPTILEWLNVQPIPTMIGAAMGTLPAEKPLQEVTQSVGLMRKIYELRPPLLYTFVTYEITVLLSLLVFVISPFTWRRRMPPWLWHPASAMLLLSLLAAPVILLIMGWIAGLSGGGLAAFFIAGTAVVAAVATMIAWQMQPQHEQFPKRYFGTVAAAGWIGAVGAAVILGDGLMGAQAMKRSVLGYDAMVGARYYGIGNEFMGVLIGSALLAVAVAAQYGAPWGSRRRRGLALLSLVVFATILVYMAAPSGGTNAGGSLTAAVAFAILYTRLFTRLWEGRRKLVGLIGVGAAAGIAGLLLLWGLNAWLPSDASGRTHIGKAMALVEGGRLDLIAGMIYRKLSMNLHLIGVSSWSKVLIAGLLVMIVLLMKPRGVFHRWQYAVPDLMHGFVAIVAGAVTALLLNDSGIVSAATMIIYVAVPMLLLRLQEIAATSQQDASDYSTNAAHSS